MCDLSDGNLDEFVADFKLMFNNAKIFNDDASVVYRDTLQMERVFDAKVAEITGQSGHSGQQHDQQIMQNIYGYPHQQAPYQYQQQQQIKSPDSDDDD